MGTWSRIAVLWASQWWCLLFVPARTVLAKTATCPEPAPWQPGGPCEPYFDYPEPPADKSLEAYFRINTTEQLPPAFRKQWGWQGFPMPAEKGIFWPWNGTLYDNGFYTMPRTFTFLEPDLFVMSPVECLECILGAILVIPLSLRTYRRASWRDVLWNVVAQSLAMTHFVAHALIHIYYPKPIGDHTHYVANGFLARSTFFFFSNSMTLLMQLCMLRIGWVALVTTEITFHIMRPHGKGMLLVTIVDRFLWMFITGVAMYARDGRKRKHWSTWGALLGSLTFLFGIGRAWFMSAMYGDLYLPTFRYGDRWWIPHHVFQDAGQVMALLSVLHLTRERTYEQQHTKEKEKGH